MRLDIGQRGVMDAIGGKTCWQKQMLGVMDEGLRGGTEPFTHLNITPTTVLGSKLRQERQPEPRPDRNTSQPGTHALLRGVHVRSHQTISLGPMFSEGSVRSRQAGTPSLFLTRKMSLGFSSGACRVSTGALTLLPPPPTHPPPPAGLHTSV